jgi:iron complex transport system permease protein
VSSAAINPANDAGANTHRVRGVVAACIGLAVLGFGVLLSMSVGASGVSIADAWNALFAGSAEQADTLASRIVWDLRLPRAICSIIAGAGLATAGVLLQSVTRNPLADPGLVGVTAGAGVAATIVLAAIPTAALMLPMIAFIGALVSAIAVYAVSWQPGIGASPIRMVLAGVAVNAVLGAVIGFLVTAYSDRIPSVMLWTVGSFNGRSWHHVRLILPYALVGLSLAVVLHRSLAVMDLGDDAARSLGVRVERIRLIAFTGAALLAGASVAVAGTIGFVGLVVPHVVRLVLGSGASPARVLFMSMLGGAALLLWSDLGARTVLAPSELPVGVITAAVGGPYFIYLLYRSEWLR